MRLSLNRMSPLGSGWPHCNNRTVRACFRCCCTPPRPRTRPRSLSTWAFIESPARTSAPGPPELDFQPGSLREIEAAAQGRGLKTRLIGYEDSCHISRNHRRAAHADFFLSIHHDRFSLT